MSLNYDERIRSSLLAAIGSMRDACDEAQRRATDTNHDAACRNVMNKLAWGLANASSNIDCAMSWLEDKHAMEREPKA